MSEHADRYWRCQLCGEELPTAQLAQKHVEESHAKEMAHMKLNTLKLAAKDTSDVEAQMKLMQGIADFTKKYLVNESDSKGAWTVEEVLGSADMHLLYQRVMDCGYPGCTHNEPEPDTVDRALANLRSQK